MVKKIIHFKVPVTMEIQGEPNADMWRYVADKARTALSGIFNKKGHCVTWQYKASSWQYKASFGNAVLLRASKKDNTALAKIELEYVDTRQRLEKARTENFGSGIAGSIIKSETIHKLMGRLNALEFAIDVLKKGR